MRNGQHSDHAQAPVNSRRIPTGRRRLGILGPLAVALWSFTSACTRSSGLEHSLDGTWDLTLSCLTNRQIVVQIDGENSTWEDTNTLNGCVVTRSIRISHVSTKLIRMIETELPTCSTTACSTLCTDTSELADWSYDFVEATNPAVRDNFGLVAKFTGKGYEDDGTCASTPLNTTTFTLRK